MVSESIMCSLWAKYASLLWIRIWNLIQGYNYGSVKEHNILFVFFSEWLTNKFLANKDEDYRKKITMNACKSV